MRFRLSSEPASPYARAPKIALPMRTWVAPYFIAASKSSLMPMLNCANPLRAAISASNDKLKGQSIFSGWMFASSPALSALEHPIYDVWVIDCST